MLKAPDHQVAGHRAENGAPGPLVDDSGQFYKPFLREDRWERELSFYRSFASDPRIPDRIRRFFPVFYGTKTVEASDESGNLPYLILEDLAYGIDHPSIVDIKIGSRTWYPQASEKYIQKNVKRDQESTTIPLAFRISGLQIHGDEGSMLWKPDRDKVKSFGVGDVKMALRKFVSTNSSDDSEPDCALAPAVYGGANGILAQLLELKAWFEDQTLFHFYSVSVFLLYDKGKTKVGKSFPKVKLIDFAHVFEGEGVIDHVFLSGLCSLIKFISDILSGPSASSTPCSDHLESAKD